MNRILILSLSILLIAFSSASTAANKPSKDQKTVLVTGATSGIGLRITEHLTNKGYFVYVSCLN